MTSIVYPLLTYGQELVYSLRSVEKHGTNVGEIFIIGAHTPLEGLTHIPFKDQKRRVSVNIWEKLVVAARDERVTERFLWMNDDFYIQKPFDPAMVPTYALPADLSVYKRKTPKSIYSRMLAATFDALTARHLPVINFGTHQPMVLEKANVLAAFNVFKNEIYTPASISFRCAYGNLHQLTPIKSGTTVTKAKPHDRTPKNWAFASHAHANPKYLKKMLDKLYPRKSRYEV